MADKPVITFSVKVRNTSKLLAKLAAVKGGVHSILGQGKLEAFMLRRVQMRFAPRNGNAQAQRSPDGKPWKQLKERSRRKHNQNRSQVLVDSSALRNAIKVVRSNLRSEAALASPTGAGFYIGVDKGGEVGKYARIQNNGGWSGVLHKSHIPSRRFLGVSAADIKAVDSLIKRSLLKVL
jgi:hypothetical protein